MYFVCSIVNSANQQEIPKKLVKKWRDTIPLSATKLEVKSNKYFVLALKVKMTQSRKNKFANNAMFLRRGGVEYGKHNTLYEKNFDLTNRI